MINSESLSLILGRQIKCNKIANVVIDSREVKSDDLFIGIIGQNHNGGDYADAAVAAGASLCIVRHDSKCKNSDKIVFVDEPLAVLHSIAMYVREQINPLVIAVTGSVGKTTTKEMLYTLCSAFEKTECTIGNYNNNIGMPLCLANLKSDTTIFIAEMGMNCKGEISIISKIASPDIAIITIVDAVHLEFFDSVEQIALAKAEIFDGMSKDGVAILNIDNKYYDLLKGLALSKQLKVRSFGQQKIAHANMISFENGMLHASILNEDINAQLAILGRHHALNACAAILAAKVAIQRLQDNNKLDLDVLKNFRPKEQRGAEFIHKSGAVIIDESYNASPVATKAAIDLLATRASNRKIIVLGDMKELGPKALEFHLELAVHIDNCKPELVILIGDLMHSISSHLNSKNECLTLQEASTLLSDMLKSGDMLLLKGSKSMKLEKIVQNLKG